MQCHHHPTCPEAAAVNRDAAHVIASFPEQGWSLLCNGVIMFDDTGELLPDGRTVAPHRGPAPRARIAPDDLASGPAEPAAA
jgi:hypothetical protein